MQCIQFHYSDIQLHRDGKFLALHFISRFQSEHKCTAHMSCTVQCALPVTTITTYYYLLQYNYISAHSALGSVESGQAVLSLQYELYIIH